MDFLARPVFRRMWIVQELVAAPKATVYCGSSTPFEYRTILDVIRFLECTSWMVQVDSLSGSAQNHSYFVTTIEVTKMLWM